MKFQGCFVSFPLDEMGTCVRACKHVSVARAGIRDSASAARPSCQAGLQKKSTSREKSQGREKALKWALKCQRCMEFGLGSDGRASR